MFQDVMIKTMHPKVVWCVGDGLVTALSGMQATIIGSLTLIPTLYLVGFQPRSPFCAQTHAYRSPFGIDLCLTLVVNLQTLQGLLGM